MSKKTKKRRFYYSQLIINFYHETIVDFKTLEDEKLKSLMQPGNFRNQKQLENILLNLKILVRKDRMQYTDIIEFDLKDVRSFL